MKYTRDMGRLPAEMEILDNLAREVAMLLKDKGLSLQVRRKARPLLMQAYLLIQGCVDQQTPDPGELEKARLLSHELDGIMVQTRPPSAPLRTGMRLPWPMRVTAAWQRPSVLAANVAQDFGNAIGARVQWMVDRAESLAEAVKAGIPKPRESGPADRLDLELVTGEAEWE